MGAEDSSLSSAAAAASSCWSCCSRSFAYCSAADIASSVPKYLSSTELIALWVETSGSIRQFVIIEMSS